MFGEPKDVEAECNARLIIGDNYGDGTATMRCQLPPGHEGLHREAFDRDGSPVVITWAADERRRCDHGCGQWDHDHKDESITCPKYADDHEWSDCAHCHPGQEPKVCAACGGVTYCEEDHKRHCHKEPFACEICGEIGVGPHVWPSCPKEREITTAASTGYLTDAELSFLRARTTSGDTTLFDHSSRTSKHFEPLLGYCVCAHCARLPGWKAP